MVTHDMSGCLIILLLFYYLYVPLKLRKVRAEALNSESKRRYCSQEIPSTVREVCPKDNLRLILTWSWS